ncbi:MAG TPA: hypothetical protein VLB01_05690 [Thermodesulfobacteriota bacterium]|nr:hypothetical protein [Thermodesulfobacteriota bacterium]
MNNLQPLLLEILCTGLGEGNSNTEKLTKQILARDPDRDFNQTKMEVIEALGELKESGQIQIVTMGWELGQEFLYICSRRL